MMLRVIAKPSTVLLKLACRSTKQVMLNRESWLHSHLSYETTPGESMTSVPSLCPEGTTSGGYWVHHWVALESVGPRARHVRMVRMLRRGVSEQGLCDIRIPVMCKQGE